MSKIVLMLQGFKFEFKSWNFNISGPFWFGEIEAEMAMMDLESNSPTGGSVSGKEI